MTAIIKRCVLEKKTLVATYNSECLTLADCVVVDVQCDYTKHDLGNMRTGEAEMAALEATMRTIGRSISAALPGADRDDGRAGDNRICRLADSQEVVCRARHQSRSRCSPTASSG